jgi:hypothetical protein
MAPALSAGTQHIDWTHERGANAQERGGLGRGTGQRPAAGSHHGSRRYDSKPCGLSLDAAFEGEQYRMATSHPCSGYGSFGLRSARITFSTT